MSQLRTGKLDPVYDSRDLLLEHYLTTAISYPARDLGVLSELGQDAWGMLGNDQYGDCVFAGADHEVMRWNLDAGKTVAFRPLDALADYAAVTGFNPVTGANDNGTVVRDALNYRVKTGLRDAHSARHKLGAFTALEPGRHDHVKAATYLLDAVGIGFQFPGSAMDQFNAGRPWSVVHGAQIDGGHYVCVLGYDSRYLYVITWGRVQKMTWGFFAKYCDEAWGLLSPEFLKGGVSPTGLDLAQLRADLKALGE